MPRSNMIYKLPVASQPSSQTGKLQRLTTNSKETQQGRVHSVTFSTCCRVYTLAVYEVRSKMQRGAGEHRFTDSMLIGRVDGAGGVPTTCQHHDLHQLILRAQSSALAKNSAILFKVILAKRNRKLSKAKDSKAVECPHSCAYAFQKSPRFLPTLFSELLKTASLHAKPRQKPAPSYFLVLLIRKPHFPLSVILATNHFSVVLATNQFPPAPSLFHDRA
jgi:hypothetical protein